MSSRRVESQASSPRRIDVRWAGVAAAISAAAVDVLYVIYIQNQGARNPQFLRVPFLATFIALMAICSAISALLVAVRWRTLLLGVAAGGLVLLGLYGIFSIGLPLLIAGLVAVYGVIRGGDDARPASSQRRARVGAAATAVIGAGLSVAVLLVGLSVTEVAIQCPTTGSEGGAGSVLGFSYTYSCSDGKLTIAH